MNILARQITVDMYNCKNMTNKEHAILASLKNGLEELNYTILEIKEYVVSSEELVFFILLKEGHIIFRYYPELNYVACDLFICMERSKPELAISALKKIAHPDKVRMTYLKRGDFGTLKDIKPKIKVRTARIKQLKQKSAILKAKSANVLKKVAKKIKV